MIWNIRSVINIRYAQIREMDVSNGEGLGIALFVQGCHLRCYNCFNTETWDFNSGKEWTLEVEDIFIELAKRPYIKRISILGGEPLADENIDGVLNLVNKIRLLMTGKTIWLYSGYTWEDIWNYGTSGADLLGKEWYGWTTEQIKRQQILSNCDVFIDGRYIDSQRNIQLKYRGSENQRVINIKESISQNEIVLYCD